MEIRLPCLNKTALKNPIVLKIAKVVFYYKMITSKSESFFNFFKYVRPPPLKKFWKWAQNVVSVAQGFNLQKSYLDQRRIEKIYELDRPKVDVVQ